MAEAERGKLRNFCHTGGWYGISDTLRREVEDRGYAYLPSGIAELTAWTTETQSLISRVEATMAEDKRSREEAEREAREAEERQQAGLRAQLGELLAHDWVRDDLGLAARIDGFVKEAIKIRGSQAAKLLQDEQYEAYGRARRTDALERKFPGIDHRGLNWAAGCDVEPVAFWAERMISAKMLGKTPPVMAESKNTVAKTAFEDIGGRNFRCPVCKGTERLPKAEYRRYEAGEQMPIICYSGHKGVARKA